MLLLEGAYGLSVHPSVDACTLDPFEVENKVDLILVSPMLSDAFCSQFIVELEHEISLFF